MSAVYDGPIGRPTVFSVFLALVSAVLVAGVSVAVLQGGTGVYESKALVLVDQAAVVVAAESDGVLAKLNTVRAKYAALVRTSPVVTPVADAVGLEATTVENALFVDALGGALTLNVGARSSDPERTQTIANAAAETLSRIVDEEQAAFGVPQGRRITVTVINPADRGQERSTAAATIGIVAAGAGALAAALVYFVVQLIAARS